MKPASKKEFIELIQVNKGILNSICKLYFQSEEDRKDARQEIILQLWKAYPNFKAASKWSTWIYKVALNTVLNIQRKTKKEPQKLGVTTLEKQAALPLVDDDILQLQQVISLLEHEDKALVILYLEGYNHKEIAATLNTSATNISTRLNRIKKKLKNLYQLYNHGAK